jgi:mannosyl-oligosaccharide alpha-1,2-mannosidase
VLVVLGLVYYFLPIIWHGPAYRHDVSFEDGLYSTRKPQIQHDFGTSGKADAERLQAVKDEFVHAYKGYKSRAWMKDELKPISGGTHTQYCGWAATLIDSLDTLYIMGLYDEFDEAVNAVLGMSFAYAPSIGCSINPFEMTIRHLGGLISAYDISGSNDVRLKKKALEVGDMLFQSFASNRIQCRTVIWPRLSWFPCTPNKVLSLARLGSQSLEFVRYARLQLMTNIMDSDTDLC